jgi:hypothetical protein
MMTRYQWKDRLTAVVTAVAAALLCSAASSSAADTPNDDDTLRHGLVVIDPSVPDSYLLANELQDYAVLTVDEHGDPLEQIADAVERIGDVRTLVVVSHGNDGRLSLGKRWIDRQTLLAHGDALQKIRNNLAANAEIFLYGCDVAATDAGQWFVNTLAEMTRSTVTASSDATGRDGDWELEYTAGGFASPGPLTAQNLQKYAYTLGR